MNQVVRTGPAIRLYVRLRGRCSSPGRCCKERRAQDRPGYCNAKQSVDAD